MSKFKEYSRLMQHGIAACSSNAVSGGGATWPPVKILHSPAISHCYRQRSLSLSLRESYQREYKESLNLKYIDPTYMIRAIPSNASDNVYCTLLAHRAIHGAMAGFCGFTAGPINSRHCYIPIKRVVATSRNVNIADRMWARLMTYEKSSISIGFIGPIRVKAL